jgi:Ca2+-binding EF-hand superfamily protein
MSTGPEGFHFDRSKSIGLVNADDIDSIRHAFATFDKDGSGTIDAEELYLCLKAMGHHPGPLELEELLAQMDTNGDGVISFEEFAAVMAVSKGVRNYLHCSHMMLKTSISIAS